MSNSNFIKNIFGIYIQFFIFIFTERGIFMENDVYRALQQHLDKDNSPVGYPKTKSGVDLKLLRLLITPEEAEIAANLSNIKLESDEKIYKRIKKKGIKMSLDELKSILERMKEKGVILAYSDGF